jgi:hypothetical protein
MMGGVASQDGDVGARLVLSDDLRLAHAKPSAPGQVAVLRVSG